MTRHGDTTGSGTCKPVNVTALHMQRCVHVQFRRYTARVNPLRQRMATVQVLKTGFVCVAVVSRSVRFHS